MLRHPPPTYEQNQASDSPVYDEEEDAPGYDERRYTSTDPYAQGNTDMPENGDDPDRDVDPHAQVDDDDDEDEDDPMKEASDPEAFRRELAERESGFERESLTILMMSRSRKRRMRILAMMSSRWNVVGLLTVSI
jgi:hypothetical protein